MTDLEREWSVTATDLGGWANRAMQQLQRAEKAEAELAELREAVREEIAHLLQDMETVETELDDVRGLMRQHYPIVADNIDRLIAQEVKPRGES